MESRTNPLFWLGFLLFAAQGSEAMINGSAPPVTVNISFVKEVTLSIGPPELADLGYELPPSDAGVVNSFLKSAMRLLDPIMDFFHGYLPVAPHVPAV